MSGRLSNLSLSRVDWERHRKLVDLIAREREKPGVLAAYLRSLGLKARPNDAWTLERMAESKLTFLEAVNIRAVIRSDPQRGPERAAELLRSRDAGLVESHLLELALVDPDGDRWNGEVWLTSPEVFLAWFSPSFRESLAGCLRKPGAGAAPASAPAGDLVVEAALGGVFVNEWASGSTSVDPGDAVHDPLTVSRIAEAMRGTSVGPAPRGPGSELLVLYAREAGFAERLEVADDAAPEVVLEALREWAQEPFDSILELYADAASRGQALEVCWHPNP